jgi:tetratricopeptide (TPR) repeat protein
LQLSGESCTIRPFAAAKSTAIIPMNEPSTFPSPREGSGLLEGRAKLNAGDYHGALRLAEQALDEARMQGWPLDYWAARALQIEAMASLGKAREVLDLLHGEPIPVHFHETPLYLELKLREAYCELLLGRFAEAENILRKLRGEASLRGDALMAAQVDIQMGNLHFYRRQWGEARRSYDAAYAAAVKHKNAFVEVLASTGVAKARREALGYKDALPCFLEALRRSRELGNKVLIAILEGEVGHCYCFLNELDQAESHLLQALALDKELSTQAHEHIHLADLGNVWLRRDRPDKAVEYFQKALAGAEKTDNSWSAMRWSYNLSLVYLKLQDYPAAETHLIRADRLSAELNDQHYQTLCLMLSAQINSEVAGAVGKRPSIRRPILRG